MELDGIPFARDQDSRIYCVPDYYRYVLKNNPWGYSLLGGGGYFSSHWGILPRIRNVECEMFSSVSTVD